MSDDLRLLPLVHVDDVPSALRFYEKLGGQVERGGPEDDWATVAIGGGSLGLLAHPPNPEQSEDLVELS